MIYGASSMIWVQVERRLLKLEVGVLAIVLAYAF